MKKTLLSIAASLMALCAMAQAPAFPGAEGHGRYVTGGRGKTIRHVTNLSGADIEGSFRRAVGYANSIVVFDVAGVIELTGDVKLRDNVTILGQTAPAPGITLRYRTLQPGNNNIIRFIRIRRGEEKDVNDGADATWQRDVKNVIFDHCSFSWSIDELASFYDNQNFTMQWCSLGEALANPGHSKGEHSYGGIWGGKLASFHHNFIAHVQNRAPRFCGARYNSSNYDKTIYGNSIQAEIVDFRNCVMYNWGIGNGCYGGTGGGQINIVNNYYKAGPATVNKTRTTQISVADASNASGSPFMGYCSRYYIDGNYVTAAGNDAANYDWKGVKYDDGTYLIDDEYYCPDSKHLYGENVTYVKNSAGVDCVKIKMDSPVAAGKVTTHSAEKAFEKVLDYVGASLYRDNVDKRYMKEAKNGTTTYTGSATQTGEGKPITHYPGIIDKVADQGGYYLNSATHPEGFDADGDGMADEWERLNGGNLDPHGYDLDPINKWYTNLEVYANSLVEHIMQAENEDAISSFEEYYPECVKLPVEEPTEPTINCNIVWPFDLGTEGQTATLSGEATTGISSSSVSLGTELEYNGKQSAGGLTETKIQQTNVNGTTPTDANAITFSITMAEGYTLQATSVSFTASRIGTDKGKLDAKWIDANGTEVLCQGVTPNRNNASPAYTAYENEIDREATSGTCQLVINLYDLSFFNESDQKDSLKDYGFCNITIEGILTNAAGISTPVTFSTANATEYYNMAGQRVSSDAKGLVIVRQRMADGTVKSFKVIR